MKYLIILLFLPFLAFSQNCPDDFWKQAVLAGEQTIEIQLKKGQGYKPIIIERKDTTEVETWVLTKKITTTPPKPDLVASIDNVVSESRNKYSGSWSHFSNQPWLSTFHEKTGSFTASGFLETSFDGHKIEWYTEKRFNHGIAAVSIDGGAEINVDLYNSTTGNNSQLVWTSPTLENKPHTIKIRYTGSKNSAASEATIIHDFFKVFKVQ